MARRSSTSASERRPRPLRARELAVVLLVALAVLEIGLRVGYEAPAPMRDKARAYDAADHGTDRELLILGTCLPEAIVEPAQLAAHLGGDVRVHNLATPAGTSRLWVLFLRHHLPDDARVAAILIPFGEMDLTKLMAPWESQAMELAHWTDMPDLVRWGCDDTSCALELMLRKGYRTYRHRGYLANWFWLTLGTRPPIPGSLLSPGEVDPSDQLGAAAQAEDVVGAAPDAGADLAWSGERKAVDDTDPSRLVYLRELLEIAADRGIPVVFTPLPTRAQVTGVAPPGNHEYRARIAATIREGGGYFVDLSTLQGLRGDHFVDDVHLGIEGRQLVTAALGDVILSGLRGQPAAAQ